MATSARCRVLLLCALIALAPLLAAADNPTSDGKCDANYCSCANNYKSGYCQELKFLGANSLSNSGSPPTDTNKAYTTPDYSTCSTAQPSSCPSLPDTCSCVKSNKILKGSNHVVGQFKLYYPLNPGYWSRIGFGTTGSKYSSTNTIGWRTKAMPAFYGDGSAVTREVCCKGCHDINSGATSDACRYWQHVVLPEASCTVPNPWTNATIYSTASTLNMAVESLSSGACGYCLIYGPSAPDPTCTNWGTCTSGSTGCGGGTHTIPGNFSSIGKGCAHAANDPHFLGAHGTRFEFNGLPDQSFCLLTNALYHVNMGMVGYLDDRTVGASILKNGKAVRTWIGQLGIMWLDAETGVKHTVSFSTRRTPSAERVSGYMKSIVVDGEELLPLQVDEEVVRPGGFSLMFSGYDKEGGGFFDVDLFYLKISTLLELDIRVRVAHPLLRTDTDAMSHINLRFVKVQRTGSIHGVLGQTFRDHREKRTMDYTSLSTLLGRSIAADDEMGAGFLDGQVGDYKSSGLMATDCKYTAYDGQTLPDTVV